MVAGVCLGVAEYLTIDPTLVRLFWAFLLLPGGLPGFVPYIICWVIIPEERSSNHRVEQGEVVA